MTEIQMDNGIEGPGRVERTPTGFKSILGDENGPEIEFSMLRGVDFDGKAHIDIDVTSIDEVAQKRTLTALYEAIEKAGLGDKASIRSDSKLRIYVTDMEGLLDVLEVNV